jgi:hypothetical protein
MIPAKTWVTIALVGLALTSVGGAYIKGRFDGDAAAQAKARQQLVEQLTERNRVNESVSRMSSADLCRSLGGVFVDGVCN